MSLKERFKNIGIRPLGSEIFQHGSLLVASAGTAQQLASDQECQEVLVTAKVANTGWIYIGNVGVSSSGYGLRLDAGESLRAAIENLNLIYIDASVAAEGVDFLCL